MDITHRDNVGKIAAIVGAPGVGKSTLARYFENEHDFKAFFEGDNGLDFPKFVKENISKNKNPLQTNLFFQNLTASQYLEALKHKARGERVVVDTFWLTNFFYLDAVYTDPNDRELMRELVELSQKMFPAPDAIIYMRADDDLICSRIEARGRDFEKAFLEKALKVNRAHEKYFISGACQKEFPLADIFIIDAANIEHHSLAQKLFAS